MVGEIPARLPSFDAPRRSTTSRSASSPAGALAIALLGLLEAIAMAKAIAAHTRQKLDMNQQCLSEGLANLAGSFFQCLPGSGSLTRSAINQQAGAVTQWSGVISAAAVALIMLAFAPYARFIPRAALAGILMVSAWHMIDWRALPYHLRATRFDAAIVAATALSAVAISVEFCILIGVLLSFLLTVPRAGRMLLTEFTLTPDGGVRERSARRSRPARACSCSASKARCSSAPPPRSRRNFAAIEERIGARNARRRPAPEARAQPGRRRPHLLEDFLDRVKARGVHVLLCGVRTRLRATSSSAPASARSSAAALPRAAGAAHQHDAGGPPRRTS